MAKTLSEYSIVSRTAEDMDLLAECMAASIDERFMRQPNTSRDVKGIAVIGSMNAGKSRFIDRFAEGVLPDSIQQHFLSFHGDPNYDGRFSALSGQSVLHGRRQVVLSYKESDPTTFWERFDQPGIHFDQNIRAENCVNGSLEVCIRAPLPEVLEDRAEIFSPQDNEGAPELDSLRQIFTYADDNNLRRAGVLRAFRAAIKNNAEQPRLFRLRVFDEDLDTSSRFKCFTRLLEDIKKSPNDVSELIKTAHSELMNSLPSARQTRPKDEFVDLQNTEEGSFDGETIEDKRQNAFEHIEGLSESELTLLDAEGRQYVQDLQNWKAYNDSKAASSKTLGPGVPPKRPERADRRRIEKILKDIEPKMIAAGPLHFDLGRKKIFFLNKEAMKEYARNQEAPDVSVYDFAKNEDLSDEECLFIRALYDEMDAPVSRPILLEKMYENHVQITLDAVNIVAYSLRRKISKLGGNEELDGKSYIPAVSGKGFALIIPVDDDFDPNNDFDDFHM